MKYKTISAKKFGGGFWEDAHGSATLVRVDGMQYLVADVYHIKQSSLVETIVNPAGTLMARALNTNKPQIQPNIPRETWLDVDVSHTTGTIDRPSMKTDSWNAPGNEADGLFNDPWILDVTGYDVTVVTMKYDLNELLNPIHGQISFDFSGVSWTGEGAENIIQRQAVGTLAYGIGPSFESSVAVVDGDGLCGDDTAYFNVTVVSGSNISRAFVWASVLNGTGSQIGEFQKFTELVVGQMRNISFKFASVAPDTYTFTAYLMNETLQTMNGTRIAGVALEECAAPPSPKSSIVNVSATIEGGTARLRWNVSRDVGAETMEVIGIVRDSRGNFTASFNLSQGATASGTTPGWHNLTLPDGLHQCILHLLGSDHARASAAQLSLLINRTIQRFFTPVGIVEASEDADSDGLIDRLTFTIPVSAQSDGNYSMHGELRDSIGAVVASASNTTHLTTGAGTASLQFFGTELSVRHAGGSMTLDVEALDENSTLLENVAPIHHTSEYGPEQFERPGLIISSWQSDVGVDQDANSLFDSLRVSLGVNVSIPGNYTVVGELLHGQTSICLANNATSLPAGEGILFLDFPGGGINKNGIDDNYRVEVRTLVGESSHAWSSVGSYMTAAYFASDFEPCEAYFNGAVVETLTDSDSDGKYNYLSITLGVEIQKPDNYTFSATLVSEEGLFIESLTTVRNMSTGSDSVDFAFSGEAIYRSWANGTLKVVNATVHASQGQILDSIEQAWATGYHDHDDFDPPRITILDSFSKWLRDTDSDGVYDVITVNCTVSVTEPMWYLVRGFLYSSNGSYIDVSTNSASLGVGVHTIPLQFDYLFGDGHTHENENVAMRYVEAYNSSMVLLAINPANYSLSTDTTAPVANAGQDQTAVEGAAVALDGSGSADNLGVVNYTWTFIDNGTAVTLYSVAPTYVFHTSGEYNIILNVTDAAGNSDADIVTIVVTKAFSIELVEGWNMVSIPLYPTNSSILSVLASIDGKWDRLMKYVPSDVEDPWKQYNTMWSTSLNEFDEIDAKVGFWLNATEACTLTASGMRASSTVIPLRAGWNLVGYPTLAEGVTVGVALWGTGATMVEVFNPAATYRTASVGSTYVMKPGEGYWVYVPADTIWTVGW